MQIIPDTYAISVNFQIVDKPDVASRGALGRGWDPLNLTEQQLAEHVQLGHAYAPQYRGGHRKTAKFIRAGFLAADVDRGRSLDDAVRDPFVQQHAAFIHTTASHTAEHNRYRIVFLLEQSLTAAQDYADAQYGLALALGGDRSVADGARCFFGNTAAIVHHIGNKASPTVVADLIARGRDARLSRAPGGKLLPVNSARRIAGPELVKVAGGALVRMDELPVGMRIHCPHHDDGDPSAFTVRSTKGAAIGIHCSACKVTFWPAGADDDYDFGAFDRLFSELASGQQKHDTESTGLDRFFPPAPRFERMQQEFLPAIGYEPGITLVKSPKGSGKTEMLLKLVQAVKAGQFRSDIVPKERAKSILLIGHRQSLLREAAAKLGLVCYLDVKAASRDDLLYFAVCLDSLPKYSVSRGTQATRYYDLVIIDEVEQVVAHLLSETISARYGIERCFDAFMYQIANAKAVIALDADLGLATAHAMRTMRPPDWVSRCRIIVNEPMPPTERRVMHLHKDKKFLENQVIEAIKTGQRCFIVSNSKRFITVLQRMILDQCGDDVVLRVITSDNSRDEATVRFLLNIKTEFLNVQVVAGTPSIGTGIDITFPDGACHVDRVFGFFYPFVNTHTDIDQQLARIRNPGAVDVWISPAGFNFTSNIEVIKDDLARGYTVKRAVIGVGDDGMVEYHRDDPLLTICAHVTALQRASKNRLVELFCALREANGWTVERVAEKAASGPFEAAKEMVEVERREMLLAARRLDDAEWIELDAMVQSGAQLAPRERVTHEVNEFEREVGVRFSEDFIELAMDGRLRERVANFAAILTVISSDSSTSTTNFLLGETKTPKGRLQGTKPELVLAVLLRAAGLVGADRIELDRSFSLDDFARFVAICEENRTVIEEILDEPIRGDFAKNPTRQLNGFMRRIGLQLKLTAIEKLAGRKIRYYAIDRGQLKIMTGLARSYLQVQRRREEEWELLGATERKRLAKASRR